MKSKEHTHDKKSVEIRELFRKSLTKSYGYCGLWKTHLHQLQKRGLILILMYHRILPAESIKPCTAEEGMICSREAFERQLSFLSENFVLMDFDDLSAVRNQAQHLRRPGCLITFDDGWRDNYIHAYPLLKKFNAKATVFLSTGLVDTREHFWFDIVYQSILNLPMSQSTRVIFNSALSGDLNELRAAFDPDSFSARRNWAKKVIRRLKQCPAEQIFKLSENLKNELCEHSAGHFQDRSVLNAMEIQEMAGNHIKFGAHGVTHALMTQLCETEICNEVNVSIKSILELTGRKPKAFAYPNGNATQSVIDCLEEKDIPFAVTTIPGYNRIHSNPYHLHRIGIHNGFGDTLDAFKLVTLGRYPKR